MKKRKMGSLLPPAMLVFGTVAMTLRRQLYLTAVDDKGLLLRNTPLEMMLLALTGAVLGIVFLAVRNDRGSNRYEDNYTAGVPGALGHVAAAVGIFTMTGGAGAGMSGYLVQLGLLLKQAAPVCLVLAGVLRLFGKKPFFLLHVIPCLFLLTHMVGSYQLWSSNPQLQDYLFAMLAMLALTVFAHFTAAFEVGLGNRKMVLGTGLAAVYLCLAELGWSDHYGLYFGGMLWALTGICRLNPVPAEEKE